MSVKVTFDKNAVMMRLKGASEKAVFITAQQVLKDSNYYCKQDQSGLIDSSITHSEPKKGILRWKTPYAKRQYYLKSTSKDVNSNAEWMWAHKAQSIHGDEWKQVYQNMFSKETKKR